MKIKKLTKNQKKLLECQRKPFKGDAPINKKSKKEKVVKYLIKIL